MSRAAILRESSELIAYVKELNSKRQQINDDIAEAQKVVGTQKREAELISAIMQRNQIPDINQTQSRVDELKRHIKDQKEEQERLKIQVKELHRYIDDRLSIRDKMALRDQVMAEIQKLKSKLEKESKKESELKLLQTKLSQKLLKKQIEKKSIEQKLAEAEPELPDIDKLLKKKRSVEEQLRILNTRYDVFQQELESVNAELDKAREKKKEFDILNEQIVIYDPDATAEQLLAAASANLSLRRYTELTKDAQNIKDLEILIAECEDLVIRANNELEANTKN